MCDAFGKKQPAAADPPLIYVATSRRECVRAAEEGVRKPHGPFEALSSRVKSRLRVIQHRGDKHLHTLFDKSTLIKQ